MLNTFTSFQTNMLHQCVIHVSMQLYQQKSPLTLIKILTKIVLYEEIEELKGLDVSFKGTLSWIVEGMKFISRAINTMSK